jgi:hypothetical protein
LTAEAYNLVLAKDVQQTPPNEPARSGYKQPHARLQ